MAVYLINSYNIHNMDDFKAYPPQVSVILKKYGAEVLASDIAATSLEGQAKTMNAIIKFPSHQAVLDCYNDPEYQAIRPIRLATTSDCTMVIVKEFGKGE